MKKPTAEGNYLAIVTVPVYGFVGRSKKSGTSFISLPLKIIEPDSDQKGAEITWYGYLTEKTIERTTKTLATLFGWDGNITSLVDDTIDPFTNKECRVAIEEQEYDGKKTFKATWLNSVDEQPKGERVKKDEFPDLAELTATARSIVAATKSGDKPKKSAAKRDEHIVAKSNGYQPQTVDDDGDEIPF